MTIQEALKHFPASGGSIVNISSVASEQAQQMVSETPLGGRFGQPDQIALVVVFLASDDAAGLTGERMSASGGIH